MSRYYDIIKHDAKVFKIADKACRRQYGIGFDQFIEIAFNTFLFMGMQSMKEKKAVGDLRNRKGHWIIFSDGTLAQCPCSKGGKCYDIDK